MVVVPFLVTAVTVSVKVVLPVADDVPMAILLSPVLVVPCPITTALAVLVSDVLAVLVSAVPQTTDWLVTS